MTARALLLLSLILLLTSPAFAQGTSGMLPDPISSRKLDRYATLLGMSPQQRLAMESAHDEYLTEFGALRETEIEQFLQESSQFRFGLFSMSAEQIKAAMKQQDGLVRRIRAMDARLLEQVRLVLTETQAADMIRVEQARQRDCDSTGLPMLVGQVNQASRLDLGVLLEDLAPSAETWQRVDAELRQYETSLTAARRKVSQASVSLLKDATKRMEELGFDPSRGGQPSRRRSAFREYRTMLGELSEKVLREMADVASLNRRTVTRLRSSLDDETWRELRDVFYSRGYPPARSGANPGVDFLRIALDRDDLDDETRQTFADLLAALYDDTDRITDEAVEVIAEQRRAPPAFLVRNDELRQRVETRLEQLTERRGTVNDAAIRAASGLLDPEIVARIERRVSDGDGDETETPPIMPGFEPEPETAGDVVAAPDPFLPGPITGRDCLRYGERLGLDETKQAIVASMHEDYLESFAQAADPAVKRVRVAQERLWTVDDEGNVKGPEADDIADLYRLRRAALDAIIAADAAFFDDVELVLSEDEAAGLAGVRLDRRRRIYGPRISAREGWPEGVGRGMNRFVGRAHDEADVDVSLLLDEVDLETDPATLATLRAEYEEAVAAIYREAFDANLRFQESLDALGAEGLSRPGGNRNWGGFWRKYRELSENEGRIARETQAKVVSLNRRTLTRLESAASRADAEAVRDAYNRRAYPKIFEDEQSAWPQLSGALALPDLTPDQQAAIQDMSVEFRAAHEELCRDLVQIRVDAPLDQPGWGGQRWRTMGDQRRSSERIESERTNLNDKTRLRLKSRLTEDQSSRIPGLDPGSDRES